MGAIWPFEGNCEADVAPGENGRGIKPMDTESGTGPWKGLIDEKAYSLGFISFLPN